MKIKHQAVHFCVRLERQIEANKRDDGTHRSRPLLPSFLSLGTYPAIVLKRAHINDAPKNKAKETDIRDMYALEEKAKWSPPSSAMS